MKIFLIGLPGSGKSTLGRELSHRLHMPFIDLDKEIEQNFDKPVREIFFSKGENFFREAEASILHDKINSVDSFVMATGGGTPCFSNGVNIMNEAGVTVFLDVPVEVILVRMSEEEKAVRPLLAAEELTTSERLTQLREQRLKFYNQATIILRGGKITVEEISKKIPKS